jgi:hypothetical protein
MWASSSKTALLGCCRYLLSMDIKTKLVKHGDAHASSMTVTWNL